MGFPGGVQADNPFNLRHHPTGINVLEARKKLGDFNDTTNHTSAFY
jgi:hypothetical protein